MTPVIVTHCTPARLGVTNSTILDPKCDILFIPDGVLGAGEAMRRREFIAFVGSTAATWSSLRAQQPERTRRIGVLMNRVASDTVGRARQTSRSGGGP